MPNFNPKSPTKFLGTDQNIVFFTSVPREPTTADYRNPKTGRNYNIGTIWQVGKDPTTGTEGDMYILTKIVSNQGIWEEIAGVSSSGTFTPGLAFGGASVDIDYNSQVGRYSFVDDMVFFSLYIDLDSKGSSTGNVTVTGFPVDVGSITSQIAFVQMDVVTFDAGYNMGFLRPLTGTSRTAEIFQMGDGQIASNLDDMNFADNSNVRCQGFYFTS